MRRPFALPWPSKAAGLALGGGLLVALSLPPWGFWPLAFLGVALFEVSLGERPTRSQRAARGWLFGAGWLFPGLFFLWYLSAPGYLVAASLFVGAHSLAALVSPTGVWRVIGRPAAHTLAEGIRFIVPFGGVPVASLAIGQASGPFLGVVRVGGALLLTWIVFQIGFALAGPSPYVPAFAARRGGRSATSSLHGVIALAAVVVIVIVAALAPSGHDLTRDGQAQTLRIAVVQGGGPQGTRAIDTDPRDVVERHLEATTGIAPGSADLVLWPENVIDVEDFATSRELTEIAAEAQRIGVPFSVGLTDDVPSADGRSNGFRNAQVIVSVDGEVTDRYDKVRRVPYGEYVPLRGVLEAVGAPVDQIPRDAVAGTGPAILDLPTGERLGVVISWEVFFGSRARDGVQHDAQVIVNPTNGSSYTGTMLQTQQVASSRLRAVETGRWVVQAAPTGFSVFIDDDGNVYDRTVVGEQIVINRDVVLRGGRTWYTVVGDWTIMALVAIVFAFSWWATKRSERAAVTARPTP